VNEVVIRRRKACPIDSPNFEELSQNETAGVDYRILLRQAKAEFAIVAPHGGGIEPGTSEIADAIAGEEFSLYDLEALKSSGNHDLHITATRFDEPMCLTVIGRSKIVVTIHGEHSEADGEGVFVGGLNHILGTSLGAALKDAGFDIRKHPDPKLQGLEPKNLCNCGTSTKGVQFELSRSVRQGMFSSLSREGRKHTTARFGAFVEAVRSVLVEQTASLTSNASG
jgi:phage replication-related protein YjqB (UPF0714/DUF867 family)